VTSVTTRLPVAALALVAVAVSGCLDAPVQSVAPTSGPTPAPTPVTTTYKPGSTVWYEGLVIHVDVAIATLDERGGPVQLGLRLENPNDEDGELDARVLLELGGDASTPPLAPTRESKIPSVPAHGIVGAVLTYELQGVGSAEQAVVLIGEAPSHVARVPLTPAGGEPAFLEPVNVAVSGRADVGTLRVTLRGAVVRWDLPDWSQELKAEVEAMTLTYDATYLGSFTGGFALTGNVALRLPDGRIIESRPDGRNNEIGLIGAHQTIAGLFSRFEVPNGTKGKLALVVRNGSRSRAIPFTIPG